MPQLTPERNPFMLMMHPELVLAAVAKSEGLEQLHRHLCRPMPRRRRWSKTTTTWNCLPKTDCAAATRGGGCYERISLRAMYCVRCILCKLKDKTYIPMTSDHPRPPGFRRHPPRRGRAATSPR